MDSLELLELKLTGKLDRAEAILQQDLLDEEDNLSISNDKYVKTIDNLINVYLCQRKYQEAKNLLENILEQQIIYLGKESADVEFILSRLVEVSHSDTMYPSSFQDTSSLQQQYLDLLAIQEKLWQDNRVEVAYTLLNLASFTIWNDNLKSERENFIHRALLIFYKKLPLNSIELANGFSYVESIYRRCGYTSVTIPTEKKIEELENLLTRALKIYRQQLDSLHPLVLSCLTNLAKIKHELQKYSEAEELIGESLTAYESIFHPQHHYVYQQHLQLFYSLQREIMMQTPSEEKYQQFLSIKKQLDADKEYMAKRVKGIMFNDENADTTLVSMEEFFGDEDENENEEIDWQDYYTDLMDRYRQYLQTDNLYVANFLENLAYDSQSNFNFQEAESSHLRALYIRRKLLKENHPEIITSLKNLAYLYQLQEEESLSDYCLEKIVTIENN